jgi:hypothetical protein
MDFPTFESDGDPTDESLDAIQQWEPDFDAVGDPWGKLIEFAKESWNMDYGTIREETDDDGERLLCFITGGWSANEAVQGAMNRNLMFHAMRWHSSYRGGMVKYSLAAEG